MHFALVASFVCRQKTDERTISHMANNQLHAPILFSSTFSSKLYLEICQLYFSNSACLSSFPPKALDTPGSGISAISFKLVLVCFPISQILFKTGWHLPLDRGSFPLHFHTDAGLYFALLMASLMGSSQRDSNEESMESNVIVFPVLYEVQNLAN